MSQLSIVWFRRDLRVEDNPALTEAAARGRVLPLFVWAPDEEAPWLPGAASRVWLHASLERLAATLRALGSPLVIRRGDTLGTLLETVRSSGAHAVLWNRGYEPAVVARDTRIKAALRAAGVEAASFGAALINEPHAVRNRQGAPFRVFTPFYKHCLGLGPPPRPLPAPRGLEPGAAETSGVALEALALTPRVRWDRGIHAAWTPGRPGALEELDGFVDRAVTEYASERDRPDRGGVSRLSPHLHFGEISPREVWHAVRERHRAEREGLAGESTQAFLRQLYWREFAHHLLFHFPHTAEAPLDERFAAFPWTRGGEALAAWQRGETGYPLVDAGMRELWSTGWMHNRVRMNVASFLVKHLLTHWIEGARWFWDTLVDADLANNTMGWQWSAGCGADAAPYFRIFNPIAQGERFDPQGRYVRNWVPELAALPDHLIHKPWQAPHGELERAGVTLGRSYPQPIVEHRAARERALAALGSIRRPRAR